MSIAIVSFLGELHAIVSDVRGNFELVDAIRQAQVLQKAFGSFSDKVEKTFSALQAPMAHTRLLAWAGVVASGYNLKKAYANPKPDKIDQSLNIALNVRTGILATTSLYKGFALIKIAEISNNRYVQTAFAVATVASTPLAIVGSMLSAAVLGMAAYEYTKVSRFAAEWEKHKMNPREQMDLLKNLPPEQFEKIFRCEKKEFQVNWDEMTKKFSKKQRNSPNGNAVLELRKQMAATLEPRIKGTLRLMEFNLASVALYATGCWMNIFKVASTASSILKNGSAGWTIMSGTHQLWSSHAFSKGVEQIKKD